MVATLDTNVLISGTLFGGVPGAIVDAAIDRRFILALSPAILDEYENVLRRAKFGLDGTAIDMLVQDLKAHTRMVYPTKKHRIVSRDPADDAVIERAVESGADVIVSGDVHLTDLGEAAGVPVVTPAQFVEMIN